MRIFLIMAAAVALIGGAVATIKVPNVRSQERVLARYRANPDATLISMRAAILKCVPGIAQSRVGTHSVGTVILPLYVKILHMRQDGADRTTISTQVRKWIANDYTKLLANIPDKDFLELVSYIKAMGEDDIENCILDAASETGNLNETTKGWGLRV